MKIHFKGAARTVTGSKHLLELQTGTQILLDCGMYQGRESNRGKENTHFGFEPRAISMLFLSHAHIDHSGLIPRLVQQGFKGPVYCTEPTLDLCQIMLADSAHIQMSDANYGRKHGYHDTEQEPLYDLEDVQKALELFVPLEYDRWHEITPEVSVYLTYVGHIIGSACINLRLREGSKIHRLAYTGDIGRPVHQIIKAWEPFPQAEVIITESTYGDRLHEDDINTKAHLLAIVQETCVAQKGKLIIPSFSLGRTQEIVYALDQLETEGKLPGVKVFVDSPLSTNATEIIRRFPDHYNRQIREYMKKDANPFGFDNLHYIRDVKYSKLLNTLDEPCIIISASGMVEAGRILHHVKNNVEDPRNTILLVGYCEPSTIGGQLRNGAERIRIYGHDLKVRARVEVMDSYSAHGDYEEMAAFLSCQDPSRVKQLYLVHGKYDTQQVYANYLQSKGFHHVAIPADDEVVSL